MATGKYKEWLEPEGLTKLEAWARNGLTDEQIAHNMGINVATLYVWKKTYPDISEALKKGKEVVDIAVENALLKRALGYSYTEITEELDKDTGIIAVTKKVIKEAVPDTTAQIFWLKNRKPDVWRDRRDINVSNEKPNLDNAALDDKIKELEKELGINGS